MSVYRLSEEKATTLVVMARVKLKRAGILMSHEKCSGEHMLPFLFLIIIIILWPSSDLMLLLCRTYINFGIKFNKTTAELRRTNIKVRQVLRVTRLLQCSDTNVVLLPGQTQNS